MTITHCHNARETNRLRHVITITIVVFSSYIYIVIAGNIQKEKGNRTMARSKKNKTQSRSMDKGVVSSDADSRKR